MDRRRPLTAAQLFDAIGAGYQEAFGRPPVVDYALGELLSRLPPRSRVLDIGSGTGLPVAHDLAAAGHRVTGLDVSPVMIEIARRQLPDATFQRADVRDWDSPERSWEAICAFFPFLQMSRADTAALLGRIAGWLVPGGCLMVITVPLDVESLASEFLGHPVEITSFSPDGLAAQVAATGLRVEHARLELFQPDRPGAAAEDHLLIIARR